MTSTTFWSRILALSEAILSVARAGDFEAVERLDEARRTLLAGCEVGAVHDCPAASRELLLRVQTDIEQTLEAHMATQLRHSANVRRMSDSLATDAFSQ